MVIGKTPVLVCSVLGTVIGGAAILKDYRSGGIYNKKHRADGKVFIVTGANSGIGKETVKSLALRGATVYMACRDLEKCEEIRKDIVLTSMNKYIYCRKCDLASFESIRKFVETFKQEQDRLDVLINNAGVMRCPKSLTKEGIEMQLGVNHMGHFLLTNLLLDKLKESVPSRIVNVSSDAHKSGTINKEDLNLDNKYDPGDAYNQSKLANILFSNELSTLLIGSGVSVYSVHPGIVDTNIIRHLPVASGFTKYIFYPFFWPFVKNPHHGAQTSLYCALEPSIANETGKYYNDMKVVESSSEAQDVELAKWLWAVSEKWTRLK